MCGKTTRDLKVGARGSNLSTLYRYFESKHRYDKCEKRYAVD